MATNNILQFGASSTSILSQSAYNTDADRTYGNGYSTGVARSALVNKVLLQTSTMSSALAQFIVNKAVANVNDTDSVSTVEGNIEAAITAMINATAATQGGNNVFTGANSFVSSGAKIKSTDNTHYVTLSNTGTSDVTVDVSTLTSANRIAIMTSVASTSGTSIDFTGIPSWAKRITFIASGISTSGTSNTIIQLGSTTIQTSGYKGAAWTGTGGAANNSIGFLTQSTATATDVRHFTFTFVNISGNTWVGSLAGGYETVYILVGGGSVTLSGVLDRLRFTTVNGTDQFDAGTVNVIYEG